MTLAWLRIRFAVRQALGIRDIRQGILRQRIGELKAWRLTSEEARYRRRVAFRLTGWCLLFASLAVVVWVAATS